MHSILRPAAVPVARLLGSRAFAGAADVIAALGALHEERLLDAAAWTPHQHHDALIEIAAVDLSLARLAEGHTDAQLIARELGHSLRLVIYGVWAAEPPGATLEASVSDRAPRLSGTKRYASGAGAIDRALVTAGDRLFDVDVRSPQVHAVPGTWEAVGMADSGSFDVVFDRAPAIEVGPRRGYVERPGFSHGAIRVAAVWLGGAIGVARALAARLRDKTADAHEAASFGRIVSTCRAMREAIAASVDAGSPEIAALHVRRVVEHGCDEVLRECGRAGGSSLMVFDRAHARRVADLTVYLRQHHGSRDDERLGRMLLEGGMFVVSETELGTSERRWRRAPEVVDAPEMDWQIAGAHRAAPRVVVISPHPDDETLAVGGTLSILARRGASIEVVAVTDGEGSHPRSPTTSPAELAQRRIGEQTAALEALGLRARVHRLRVPDGVVEATSLARRLAPIVAGADWVLAPFAHDGHPDHESAGLAARLAGARVVEYLVWAWHWAKPAAATLPWHRFRRVTLDAEARAAKRCAIGCFESQIAELSHLPGDERVLPPAVLDRFQRPFETVLA